MKNILYITYDGLLDPVARSQVLPYLRELSKRGFNIYILSFEKRGRMEAERYLEEFRADLERNKIFWKPLRYHKTPAVPATLFDILAGYFSALPCLYKNDIGIIHARGYISALIGVLLKWTAGRRLVFDMRGFWPDEKVDAKAWSKDSLIYALFKRFERMLIKRSDEIIVLTAAAERYLSRDFPAAVITVIPCCVDTAMFERKPSKGILPDRAKGRFILTYSGSIGTFYDLEGMALFFSKLKVKDRNAFFWLVTNSPPETAEEVILKRGIDRNDFAVANLDYGEIPSALSASNFSIMFYKRRLSSAGCSPIKFAESLACGLPVVINSGIGDTEETIKEEGVGVIVDTSSPEDIERAVEKIAILVSEGKDLSVRCRRAAEKIFSLEQAIEKYNIVYQRLS